jgi:two-component system phosphate regulon sensor histidine kinase PhoR
LRLEAHEVAAYLAPAAVAWITARVIGGEGARSIAVATVVAVAVAGGLALRNVRRIELLRAWSRRVIEGERTTAPLVAGMPDSLDSLSHDLGMMAERMSERIARLATERDELGAILGAMVEGVIVLDRYGTVLRANQRALDIFGIRGGGLPSGRGIWDLSRDVELNAVVREALGSRAPTFREVELRGAIEKFLKVTVGPIADGSAWVMVFHDVSDTKRLERVRTDFVANVSHELRTPLTAIKGFAETLLASGFADRDRARHYLSIIDRQAMRLSRLIDDLLTLSNLELGKTPIRAGPVRLADVVREVADLLDEPARRGQVTIDVSDELQVRGDADRIAQIVSNLLDNAIKYTPEGGTVSVQGSRVGDGTVELVFADTGSGIPAEDLPRVAERFYRVDKARSRELGGTGLGLAIVKHIVQAHGGTFRIESRVGQGTTVRIALPGSTPPGVAAIA